jgi:prolyl-tRNA editing enzyme YbaK/EbsC (Cys-tRNA(Pro) deacylase)
MFALGTLSAEAASARPDLLAPSVLALLTAEGLLDSVGVVEIDPEVSDTAATRERYELPLGALANCVIVGGRREGIERVAGVVVLASTRADVNNTVKRLLDVRKASFLPMGDAVEASGMEYGGITPVGLPAGWPIFVDLRVAESELVVIGSGVRRSKILIPGSILARLPGVRIVEGLGREIIDG